MFLRLESELKTFYMGKNPKTMYKESSSGACATICIITNTEIITANVGDCNGYLKRERDIVNLVTIHDLENANEVQRVTDAGGKVSDRRINDGLEPTRTFGDFGYKRGTPPLVSVEPAVSVVQRHPNDEYILVSSDGIKNDVALIDKDVQTGLCIFDEETMFHIPHFVNMSSVKDDNYSTCIVFLRPFATVTKQMTYDPIYRQIIMCYYELDAHLNTKVNTDFSPISDGETNTTELSESFRTAPVHKDKMSFVDGSIPAESKLPDGCVLAPYIFSNTGNIVAIHERPFIEDPGWKRAVPAKLCASIRKEHVIVALFMYGIRNRSRYVKGFPDKSLRHSMWMTDNLATLLRDPHLRQLTIDSSSFCTENRTIIDLVFNQIQARAAAGAAAAAAAGGAVVHLAVARPAVGAAAGGGAAGAAAGGATVQPTVARPAAAAAGGAAGGAVVHSAVARPAVGAAAGGGAAGAAAAGGAVVHSAVARPAVGAAAGGGAAGAAAGGGAAGAAAGGGAAGAAAGGATVQATVARPAAAGAAVHSAVARPSAAAAAGGATVQATVARPAAAVVVPAAGRVDFSWPTLSVSPFN
jgi:hypothetical protein